MIQKLHFFASLTHCTSASTSVTSVCCCVPTWICLGMFEVCITSDSCNALGVIGNIQFWYNYRQEPSMVYAMTDGTAKALAYSGVAMGLVLKGVPLMMSKYYKVNDQETIDDNDDTIWLSNQGSLALFHDCCPTQPKRRCSWCQHILCRHLNNDDWETLNIDFDLSMRMAGCFHLARLELIDIPLQCLPCTLRGITLGAFRTVLQ